MLRASLSIIALLGLSACSIVSGGDAAAPGEERAARVTQSPVGQQCLGELRATQANFTPLPDQYFGAGCSNLNTVRLSQLHADRGVLELASLGPVTCPVATALAGWARYGVDRAARQILGSPLRRIETFGSYSCRNVAGSGRRSAHATADAVDISAFVLEDGRRISILDDWSSGNRQEREFLRIVHASACKRFSTVLGPEYNRAHRDHLHLEGVAEGQTYCR